MLDSSPTLFRHLSRRNDYEPATEIRGGFIARTRMPLTKRVEMARALCDGSVTVTRLTPAQIATLCRVPKDTVCPRLRKNRQTAPDALRKAWKRVSRADRISFLTGIARGD